MTIHRELARRVGAVTGGLALALALACAAARGPADALGVVVGSALALLNFGGLAWAAGRATAGPARPGARGRALWIGASGFRLAVVAGGVGLVLTQGGVGVVGLLLSMTLVPVAVVVAGLTATRAL